MNSPYRVQASKYSFFHPSLISAESLYHCLKIYKCWFLHIQNKETLIKSEMATRIIGKILFFRRLQFPRKETHLQNFSPTYGNKKLIKQLYKRRKESQFHHFHDLIHHFQFIHYRHCSSTILCYHAHCSTLIDREVIIRSSLHSSKSKQTNQNYIYWFLTRQSQFPEIKWQIVEKRNYKLCANWSQTYCYGQCLMNAVH